MSDDTAFKIQLGLFLPKLEDTVKEHLSTIIEQHINCLRDGTLEGDELASMEEIKAVVMKNLEIFLDNTVLPTLDKKINLPDKPSATPDADGKWGRLVRLLR